MTDIEYNDSKEYYHSRCNKDCHVCPSNIYTSSNDSAQALVLLRQCILDDSYESSYACKVRYAYLIYFKDQLALETTEEDDRWWIELDQAATNGDVVTTFLMALDKLKTVVDECFPIRNIKQNQRFKRHPLIFIIRENLKYVVNFGRNQIDNNYYQIAQKLLYNIEMMLE